MTAAAALAWFVAVVVVFQLVHVLRGIRAMASAVNRLGKTIEEMPVAERVVTRDRYPGPFMSTSPVVSRVAIVEDPYRRVVMPRLGHPSDCKCGCITAATIEACLVECETVIGGVVPWLSGAVAGAPGTAGVHMEMEVRGARDALAALLVRLRARPR